MENNNEAWFGGFVTVALLMWLFSGYFSSTRIVVSYAANCYNPPIVNGQCNGKSGPSVKTYFSVNKDKQEVVSHTNQSGDTPIKYKNCAIADEENWTCEYSDNQTNTPDLGFSDGNFTTLGKKVAELDNELGIHYVSSFRWWLLEFGLGGRQAIIPPVNVPSKTTDTSNKPDRFSSVASYDEMVSSCKSIANDTLRNGFYEVGVYNDNIHIQPSSVSNSIFYNVFNSICYFTEDIIQYPKAYSASDAYQTEGFYLQAVALSPNGVAQNTSQGDSQQGTVLPVAYCNVNTYQYPTPGSQTTHCVDFQLKQTGAGTNNYHATALGIGNTISRAEYGALTQKYMSN